MRSKKYKGMKFGKMTAQPFFAEAWSRKRADALRHVEAGVKKLIEGAVK